MVDNIIHIPITYKGKEISYAARLIKFGYIHKFEIDFDGTPIIFEPDEERNYRAILDPTNNDKSKPINVDLLKLIAKTLESLSQ